MIFLIDKSLVSDHISVCSKRMRSMSFNTSSSQPRPDPLPLAAVLRMTDGEAEIAPQRPLDRWQRDLPALRMSNCL